MIKYEGEKKMEKQALIGPDKEEVLRVLRKLGNNTISESSYRRKVYTTKEYKLIEQRYLNMLRDNKELINYYDTNKDYKLKYEIEKAKNDKAIAILEQGHSKDRKTYEIREDQIRSVLRPEKGRR